MLYYNPSLHPYFVQFKVGGTFGETGYSGTSLTIDIHNKELVIFQTDDSIKTTNQKTYPIYGMRLETLLEFLTLDAINEFERALEHDPYSLEEHGGRDLWSVTYTIGMKNCQLKRGYLTLIYKDNPLEKALSWIKKYYPYVEKNFLFLQASCVLPVKTVL